MRRLWRTEKRGIRLWAKRNFAATYHEVFIVCLSRPAIDYSTAHGKRQRNSSMDTHTHGCNAILRRASHRRQVRDTKQERSTFPQSAAVVAAVCTGAPAVPVSRINSSAGRITAAGYGPVSTPGRLAPVKMHFRVTSHRTLQTTLSLFSSTLISPLRHHLRGLDRRSYLPEFSYPRESSACRSYDTSSSFFLSLFGAHRFTSNLKTAHC